MRTLSFTKQYTDRTTTATARAIHFHSPSSDWRYDAVDSSANGRFHSVDGVERVHIVYFVCLSIVFNDFLVFSTGGIFFYRHGFLVRLLQTKQKFHFWSVIFFFDCVLCTFGGYRKWLSPKISDSHKRKGLFEERRDWRFFFVSFFFVIDKIELI